MLPYQKERAVSAGARATMFGCGREEGIVCSGGIPVECDVPSGKTGVEEGMVV